MPYHECMDAPTNPIDEACGAVGSAAELARRLDVKPPTISQWARGFDEQTGELRDLATLKSDSQWRPIPERRCPAIELVTAGRVRVERLRPDVRWVRVPDAEWPGSDGRPCIDVMGEREVRHAA